LAEYVVDPAGALPTTPVDPAAPSESGPTVELMKMGLADPPTLAAALLPASEGENTIPFAGALVKSSVPLTKILNPHVAMTPVDPAPQDTLL
jgi:hypothetical protein